MKSLEEKILSQDPTEQQKDAIFTNDLNFLLRAAPGSGKTWTSCRRFIWRGANWPYSVGGIALLSFTNTAVQEFQQATMKLGGRNILLDPNYVGTFDSFVERFVLAPYGHLLNSNNKNPRLFIAPRPNDWNDNSLKVWPESKPGAKGRTYPIHAWEIMPYRDNNKTKFQSKGKPIPDGAGFDTLQTFLSAGFYTHAQR